MFYICNPNFLLMLSISIGCIMALLLLMLTLFFAPQKFSHEKNNPYECGFQPFEDSRSKFDVKYYLVAILYIIFDLELMFLLPWMMNFYFINWLSFCILFIFILILLMGFMYEWLKGALRWS